MIPMMMPIMVSVDDDDDEEEEEGDERGKQTESQLKRDTPTILYVTEH